jgi:hypothetical protein
MKRLALLLALLLMPTLAWSANSVNIDSIVAFPTYHNIGVRVYYSGDDDSNLVLQVGVRHRDRRAGVDTVTMFRASKNGANTSDPNGLDAGTSDTKQLYAGSVLMCGADSIFDFFVTVTDADGCTNCPSDFANPRTPTLSTRTWVNNTTARLASLRIGKQIWMSPKGSDSNNGLDRNHPVLTFNTAAGKMTTLGDQLRLMAGTYYTMTTDSLFIGPDAKNGIASKFYSVVGDSGLVTISGADTTVLSPSVWHAVDIGAGVTAYAAAVAAPVWPRVVTLGDTTRLFGYTSFFRFQTDPLNVASQFGCFWATLDGDSIFIRPPARFAGMRGVTRVGVAAKDEGMRISSAFWRVDSLSFRDFGNSNDAGLTPAVVNMSNQGGVVEHCTFTDCARPGIGIRYYFDTPRTPLRTHWVTVQNNLFVSHTLGGTWSGPGLYLGFDKMAHLGCVNFNHGDTTCLSANLVYPTVIVECGRGHVIRWNRVNGGADSFVRWSNSRSDTAQDALTDDDVYQNDTMNMGDDVIEPDAASGLNDRVYKNTFLGGHTPLQWQIGRGPFYYVFNTCVNQSGFVISGTDNSVQGIERGHVIIANNTFTTRLTEAFEAWAQPQNTDHDAYVNEVCVNNILNGNTAVIRDSGCLGLNEFNWNVGYVNTGTQWSGTQYGTTGRIQNSLQAWQDSTYGYGKNDQRTGSLQYADSTHWDWSPASSWSEIFGGTKARTFPGINTNTALHMSPAWWVNRSGLDDSTYVGAWPCNGILLERAGAPPSIIGSRP